MFVKESLQKCRVVTKITARGVKRCGKPAPVLLCLTIDGAPLVLCLGCARELAKEILDSVEGGKRDSDVILARPVRK